ncbi:lytic murein transglycosylase [Methylobacter psychrophilus]|uniref:lytic murein transglycosylase n=1 Tax=Methylobacter psychrophilus TaxID=96941 RepID=UPI0021D4D494|nr:lytic murein transglycosylase [Methylobacter psychrophilus]
MANLIYKRLSKLALVALLAGCASEPVPHQVEEIKSSPQKTEAPPARYPQNRRIQQSPDSYGKSPYSSSYGYGAYKLTGTYANSPAIRSFIQHMVSKQGFSETYLNGLFSRANRLDSVIRLESPAPYTGPSKPQLGSWTRYRNKFLTDAHISNGVEFWRNNADAIQQASATYGVDAEYIVGIIGVETYFGKNFGKTCIIDALTTLSFDTSRRAKYFTSELENFLLMTRDEGFDPRQPQGSWAGAMGYGQFMPSSFRKLAVDFNNDGRRDLWHPKDAVGSVANYFSRSGWQLHSPVTKRSGPANDDAVIELSTYEGNEFWRVYPNFKVIKKYNNSNKYAMAVHQLAQAIKQKYQQTYTAGSGYSIN